MARNQWLHTHLTYLSQKSITNQPQELTLLKVVFYLSLPLISSQIYPLLQNLEITLVFIGLSQNGKFVNKPKNEKTHNTKLEAPTSILVLPQTP